MKEGGCLVGKKKRVDGVGRGKDEGQSAIKVKCYA